MTIYVDPGSSPRLMCDGCHQDMTTSANAVNVVSLPVGGPWRSKSHLCRTCVGPEYKRPGDKRHGR